MGASSIICEMNPELARVLFCSWPSGEGPVVFARQSVQERMIDQCGNMAPVEFVPSTLVHIDPLRACPPLASNEVHVGNGVPGCQYFVPSIWSNPFKDIDFVSESNDVVTFEEYMDSREDWEAWLSPLLGKALVCSCGRSADECHATDLLAGVNVLLQQRLEEEEEEVPSLIGDESDDEDDEEEWDQRGASQSSSWAANETLGKSHAKIDAKPSWPTSWHWLIAQMRAATTMIFWEIFAGCAELTKQFAAEGWETGPPVDFLMDPSWDVFHPEFLGLLLGILFERRVRILHLGTPCSSISMAFNRLPSHTIRDAARPEGFPNLAKKQREMIEAGNMLVYVGMALLKEQQKLDMTWAWELSPAAVPSARG